MKHRRVLLPVILGLGLPGGAMASQAPAPQEPAPASSVTTQGTVVVELVVDDARGKPITDLKPNEVIVLQDDVRQTLGSLVYRPESGDYELRYVPRSGRVGAVSIRVLRGGSRLRGPEGPAVKPRWVPPIQPYEIPLLEALDAPNAPRDFEYDLALLLFEARADTLHHALVVEIPLKAVVTGPAAPRPLAHLAFLLRVKTDAGRTVHEQSLDRSIPVPVVSERSLSVMRFVWSSHAHLRPGRYVLEMAVMDRNTARRSVRKVPLDVEPWPEGLRVSSLSFLLGRDGFMEGDADADNPFRLDDAALVPMLHPTVAGSEGKLSLLAMLYADRDSTEPIVAAIELHRDGQLRAKAPVALPAADAEGRIRYLGSLSFGSLVPGSYVVKLVAQQGPSRAEQEATLTVTPPLRFFEN